MLIDCPECARRVSDRAPACPECGFPVAEHVAESRQAESLARDRATRRHLGATDCVRCEARGFRTFDYETDAGETRQAFEWCMVCEHTGRVALVQSERGFWAVMPARLEAFVGGDDPEEPTEVFLGLDPPPGPRYPPKDG